MVKIKSIVTAFLVVTTVIFAADDSSMATTAQSPAPAAVQQAAPEVDPWIAVDPYEDRTYPKEDVSTFARATNYTATVAVMGGIAAAGGLILYYGSDVLGYEGLHIALDAANHATIHAATDIEKSKIFLSLLSTLTEPKHALATGTYLLSFPVLNLPAGVIMAYTTKKGAQVAEEFAKQGWKVVQYTLDKGKFLWRHFSAQYMQGTLFENRHAHYEDQDSDDENESSDDENESSDEN